MSLIRRVFTAPRLGCPVIYGVSANKDTWWDNHAVRYLGWEPQDSSETYRAEIEAQAAQEGQNTDSLLKYQGGKFAEAPLMHKDDEPASEWMTQGGVICPIIRHIPTPA
jgi:uronate dehydrogenase